MQIVLEQWKLAYLSINDEWVSRLKFVRREIDLIGSSQLFQVCGKLISGIPDTFNSELIKLIKKSVPFRSG